MDSAQVSHRSLSAHLKYCAANFAAVGVVVGVFGYAGRVLGLNPPLYTWLVWATQLPDIVLIFVLLPLVLALAGGVVGLISYLPVLWLLRVLAHGKVRKSPSR